jgi:hypothetical protein
MLLVYTREVVSRSTGGIVDFNTLSHTLTSAEALAWLLEGLQPWGLFGMSSLGGDQTRRPPPVASLAWGLWGSCGSGLEMGYVPVAPQDPCSLLSRSRFT